MCCISIISNYTALVEGDPYLCLPISINTYDYCFYKLKTLYLRMTECTKCAVLVLEIYC